MDGGAWWATVHGVTKNWTQLSTQTMFTGALFTTAKIRKQPNVH